MGALAVPAFQTPEPISVTISLVMGDVRIVASDRSDTVVVVSASDPSRPSAVKAAEQVHVDYSLGRLLIKEPRTWKHYTPFGGGESIDVAIELPVGSRVEADLAMGDFLSEGRLGDSRFTTGAGNIRLDETGPLYLSTGAGRVIVDRIVGLTKEQSRALIGDLTAHVAQDKFVYPHKWTKGDLVFWDNRSTQHYAANDYYPERRRMERTAVVGDVPY